MIARTNTAVDRWQVLKSAARALGIQPGGSLIVQAPDGSRERYDEPAGPRDWQGAGAPSARTLELGRNK